MDKEDKEEEKTQETPQEAEPSNRSRVYDRLKGRYPDMDADDEEAVMGRINDDYDDYDKKIAEYEGRERELSDLFARDPQSATFLAEWSKGGDPVMELVRRYGPDLRDALDDPDRQGELAERNKEYLDRIRKGEELDKAYQENIDDTLDRLNAMEDSGEMDGDKADEIFSVLLGIVNDGVLGKFSDETIRLIGKGLGYDMAVSEAYEEGTVKGKNEKIEERLRKKEASDGTPHLGGGGGTSRARVEPQLGAISRVDTPDIWARGEMRREKKS